MWMEKTLLLLLLQLLCTVNQSRQEMHSCFLTFSSDNIANIHEVSRYSEKCATDYLHEYVNNKMVT